MLQLGLDPIDHRRVEQVGQVTGAQQFTEQLLVQAEGRRPTLGQRHIGVVQELADIAHQQRRRER
ncbi:hypothetical protein SDC9_152452 [bioreactor metagenome]|uniref:Uncharacterized protein n=1 Tax=bioreactor metagenome TaxID=1076179 RepID=A0A645EVE5_9ZZZZ